MHRSPFQLDLHFLAVGGGERPERRRTEPNGCDPVRAGERGAAQPRVAHVRVRVQRAAAVPRDVQCGRPGVSGVPRLQVSTAAVYRGEQLRGRLRRQRRERREGPRVDGRRAGRVGERVVQRRLRPCS